ncbi:hypothetical protein QT16_11695 [Pseudoalteromonas distincta]|nr:hypothetical protein QT16_11695 [Pseudoalteromonas distincta]
MLNSLKEKLKFAILLAPDAFTYSLIFIVWEPLYRLCIFVGLAEKGMEWIPFQFGLIVFVLLFSYRYIVYLIKQKSK